jgi:hypothetical protein
VMNWQGSGKMTVGYLRMHRGIGLEAEDASQDSQGSV